MAGVKCITNSNFKELPNQSVYIVHSIRFTKCGELIDINVRVCQMKSFIYFGRQGYG